MGRRLYRLLMLLPGPNLHRALSVPPPQCCCQARNLSWAPSTAILMLLPGPQCVMGPCTASHCCCLIATLCHCATFRSPSHCWWVPFCHRVLYGLPLLLARPVNLPWPPPKLPMHACPGP
ncbi:unnamed protein product [Staurois parvus]|uniref:Secreted protein n=1 Tax=Staurois parvus TaxID=386267 RepID=A0ABN9GH20_9NEOB|nr:unnamed protein product [Staurois parvus]